jgi:hypothetical protein
VPLGVVEAVEGLAGMQAQEPRPPFLGLWSRVAGFREQDLAEAIRDGALVRGPLFRGTLHLVSARDWSVFRGPCQPVLTRGMRVLRGRADSLDLKAVTAAARTLLEEAPRTASELRAMLSDAFPGQDERALGFAARMHLPLAMVATGDRFAFPRDAKLRLADPSSMNEDSRELVRRYLAAFGPASVADAQEWSGLSGLAPIFEELRAGLVSFSDERGRELFDLPGAPRPPADTPAPARFLPEFDNLVLAHADRSRVIADEHRPQLTTKNLRVNATVLHDGEVCATWTVRRTAKTATLEITPLRPLSSRASGEIELEGLALLDASEADSRHRSITVLAARPSPLRANGPRRAPEPLP